VKHRIGGNSHPQAGSRFYNKQGSVLRFETTLNKIDEL
jgi:hypothetical protein